MTQTNFQRLIDLAQRLEESGATDDAELVRLAINGLTDMSVGATRFFTLGRAIAKLARTEGRPQYMTLADGANEWGKRLAEMAHTGGYKYDYEATTRLPSNYVQPDEPTISRYDRPPQLREPHSLENEAQGLFSQLTPEQQEQALSYDGPVASGDQSLPKVERE